jgi:hypothetical protein
MGRRSDRLSELLQTNSPVVLRALLGDDGSSHPTTPAMPLARHGHAMRSRSFHKVSHEVALCASGTIGITPLHFRLSQTNGSASMRIATSFDQIITLDGPQASEATLNICDASV